MIISMSSLSRVLLYHRKLKRAYYVVACVAGGIILCECEIKGLFTWSGGPRSSGVGFFCFHALVDTKQKKLTPLDRGPPLHVNRV